VAFAALDALAPYLPEEIWSRREHFFFDGMHLEIGPCFRRYAPPAFFDAATQERRGHARLLPTGGLEDAAAGLPFPAASIAPADLQAGQKWAWNAARRYRGAGRFGDLRVTYLQGGQETARLVGDHFVALLMNRARLVEDDYHVSWAKEHRWVAGGSTRGSGSGSRCAFRHYRNAGAERDARVADDVFLYNSESRKSERVRWRPEFPMPACAYERGFYFPLGGRVERYQWKVVGVRELLAPINSAAPAYPENTARSFGPSGASLADDRWELRRAIVLEAPLGNGARVRRYLDLETLFPLYHAENPGGGADVIFQYAGRWSEDREKYPEWPDPPKQSVRVIDPVIQIQSMGTEVVRIEAWSTVAVPPSERKLRRLTSQASLARGR
jgi:hypothetical protein